jgi:hypothetical protein
MAARVLVEFGFGPDEVEASMAYFQKNHGGCDCEILLNIDVADQGRVGPRV